MTEKKENICHEQYRNKGKRAEECHHHTHNTHEDSHEDVDEVVDESMEPVLEIVIVVHLVFGFLGTPLTKTIEEFIYDMRMFGIQLFWYDWVVKKYQPKD